MMTVLDVFRTMESRKQFKGSGFTHHTHPFLKESVDVYASPVYMDENYLYKEVLV